MLWISRSKRSRSRVGLHRAVVRDVPRRGPVRKPPGSVNREFQRRGESWAGSTRRGPRAEGGPHVPVRWGPGGQEALRGEGRARAANRETEGGSSLRIGESDELGARPPGQRERPPGSRRRGGGAGGPSPGAPLASRAPGQVRRRGMPGTRAELSTCELSSVLGCCFGGVRGPGRTTSRAVRQTGTLPLELFLQDVGGSRVKCAGCLRTGGLLLHGRPSKASGFGRALREAPSRGLRSASTRCCLPVPKVRPLGQRTAVVAQAQLGFA